MTVTDVLLNFRSALLALLPVVERVGIPWKRPDAYDEWDAVVAALYENLVVQVLRWSLPEDLQEELQLPSYDLLLRSYGDVSTIEVLHPALKPGRWVFHAFGTANSPFDVIEVRHLSKAGVPVKHNLEICAVTDARLILRLFNNRRPVVIEEVTVPTG